MGMLSLRRFLRQQGGQETDAIGQLDRLSGGFGQRWKNVLKPAHKVALRVGRNAAGPTGNEGNPDTPS